MRRGGGLSSGKAASTPFLPCRIPGDTSNQLPQPDIPNRLSLVERCVRDAGVAGFKSHRRLRYNQVIAGCACLSFFLGVHILQELGCMTFH